MLRDVRFTDPSVIFDTDRDRRSLTA
ncbi:hypothetical protein SKA53_09079 [Yoonia vestfoldensis SKA53]|uniref:Uncharacterized protein n=1 Tax=Yoonia vestfoldensis SKA53 TaxID=314232 RepID=A3V1V3_9RHOB|nr:hypothetical protein SKA53_09079 [Yoonia vestfoldensis SKA53]